ncbi:MAG: twin-arginine translocase subunit TatC [Lentimicrobiaceae bacterium]|nr:twin-arginine translocase subunit TatC [Lentimicrobiaceae bacterium]
MAEEYSNKQEKKKDNGKEMTFWEHLDALRGHLFRSLMAVTAFTILAFVNRKVLFDKIILAPKEADFPTNRMLCKLGDLLNTPQLCLGNLELNIINIQLSGQFLTHMYISLAAGVVLALPYIVWEIFRFIEPGLYEHERKYARGGVWITSLLFITGVLFSYFLIVPLTIQFLGGYQVSASVANQIALGSYIKTVVSVSFAVGLVFELPVLIYFLARTGIVTAAWMRKNRKIMLVLTLVLSAIITPPDVFSQIMVAIPLIILYEFSIRIAAKVEKKRVVSMD